MRCLKNARWLLIAREFERMHVVPSRRFRPSRGMNLALCRLLWKLRESARGASAVTSPAHREEPARQGVGSAIDAAR
eukprot:COSAG03_NODE_11852_length_573_cov_1.308017_1_plen_76_part_01